MTDEARHKYFGTPLSEWVERTPNELEQDAVSLWQIVVSGREGFELTGAALDDFVKRCIFALIERGAVPVRPSAEKFWDKQYGYGSDPKTIASRIIDEWRNAGIEPDHDGLWFSIIN